MIDNHARAHARETDQAEAIRWIDEELTIRAQDDRPSERSRPGMTVVPNLTPSTEQDLFTREFVIAAYLAGREQSWLIQTLGRAVALMNECRQLFRQYEAHHRAKLDAANGRVAPVDPAALAEQFREVDELEDKVRRNAEIADRLEAFLLDPDTPQDRVLPLALSLVQDLADLIGDSEGVYGLHQNGDPAPWSSLTEGGEYGDWLSSFDRLRAELDRTGCVVRFAQSAGQTAEALDGLCQHGRQVCPICDQPGPVHRDNPADVMRDVAEQMVDGETIKGVDHESFDRAAAQLDERCVPTFGERCPVPPYVTFDPSGEDERFGNVANFVGARSISSREMMERGGVDPDAPFNPGPVPPEMREASPNLRAIRPGDPLGDPEVLVGLMECAGLVEPAEVPEPEQRDVSPLAIRLATADPRFNPSRPVTVNGFLYVPATED